MYTGKRERDAHLGITEVDPELRSQEVDVLEHGRILFDRMRQSRESYLFYLFITAGMVVEPRVLVLTQVSVLFLAHWRDSRKPESLTPGSRSSSYCTVPKHIFSIPLDPFRLFSKIPPAVNNSS